MQKAPPTPKGFRDISPDLAKKRREIINQIVEVLEDFGFVPIETPTIEFADTLKGKYGEEERLIYEFKDRGGRDLALRYDLTVPLARYVATYNPPLPFRRYQIGQVFRGENPQHGRYREFTQLDFDTVGSKDPKEDSNVISAAIKSVKQLGLNSLTMHINDRDLFVGIETKHMIVIDKLHKIGTEAVLKELTQRGLTEEEAGKILEDITKNKPSAILTQIFSNLRDLGLEKTKDFEFDPTLVRGLDYYTGPIFELVDSKNPSMSFGGGGRYDNLIGMFSKPPAGGQVPAVGFSFGLDRLIESLGEN